MLLVDFCRKCRVLSNVLKTIGFCRFFMTLRVSGVTWMVVLDGLGYDFAAWEADGQPGGIWMVFH